MSENEIGTMFKQEKTPSDQGNLLKGIENCLGVAHKAITVVCIIIDGMKSFPRF